MSSRIRWHTSDNFFLAFVEAECFLRISQMVKEKTYLKEFTRQETERSISFQYARHVNHAYALELYLKCLMIIENGKYAEGHGLLDLFELLNDTNKQEIEEYFEENHAFIRRNMTYFEIFDKPSVRELLEEANRAFIDFRYLFSRNNTPYYELDGVLDCVRNQIFKAKPELKEAW